MTVTALRLAAVAALTLASAGASAQERPLRVATWSGFYAAHLDDAVFKDFTRTTGINIRIHYHDGDLQPLIERGAGPAPWDVVDVERAELTVGCAEGRFRSLDSDALLGKAALTDFIPGTAHPCGIPSMIWSQAVAYDPSAFGDRVPRTLADFFDRERFPGKRGLFAGAEGNLEIALLADGIPPEDVYDVLRKPEGVARAFAKLQTILPAAVLWRGGGEPERLLNESRVSMTTAYAARFLRPRQGARRPAKLMWTNQLWRATYWAIAVGARAAPEAERFITFATDAPRLANLATRLWFGPARKSGFDLVPENIRADLPTARRHFHDALRIDTGFWEEMGPELDARFQAMTGR